MTYHSVRGGQFGYDEYSVIVGGKRIAGFGNPVGLGYGKTVYVHSSGSATSVGDGPANPVSTIALGCAQCTANQGDVVVVLPNHTENVAAATALCAVAGVRIVGLGSGSNRPKVTFTTLTSASYTLAVAGTTIENIVFAANLSSILTAFTLSTAKDTQFINCEFRDLGATLNFLTCITTSGAANTADGLTAIGCKWFGLGTTSVTSFITSANDMDRHKAIDTTVILARTATAAVMLTVTAGVLTNLEYRWCTGISKQVADTGGGFINVGGTTSSGIVADNILGDLSTTDLFVTTNVGLTFSNNKKTGVITASGYLLPATDS